jgi:hypothetical protein
LKRGDVAPESAVASERISDFGKVPKCGDFNPLGGSCYHIFMKRRETIGTQTAQYACDFRPEPEGDIQSVAPRRHRS